MPQRPAHAYMMSRNTHLLLLTFLLSAATCAPASAQFYVDNQDGGKSAGKSGNQSRAQAPGAMPDTGNQREVHSRIGPWEMRTPEKVVRSLPDIGRDYSIRVTTGAHTNVGWEQGLTDKDHNLKHWTWIPI